MNILILKFKIYAHCSGQCQYDFDSINYYVTVLHSRTHIIHSYWKHFYILSILGTDSFRAVNNKTFARMNNKTSSTWRISINQTIRDAIFTIRKRINKQADGYDDALLPLPTGYDFDCTSETMNYRNRRQIIRFSRCLRSYTNYLFTFQWVCRFRDEIFEINQTKHILSTHRMSWTLWNDSISVLPGFRNVIRNMFSLK